MASKTFRRRMILISVTLLVIAGMVAGVLWVYERGLAREALFEKADRAYREQRYDEAIRLAREALQAEPDHALARERLLLALLKTERLEEARAEAESLLEKGGDLRILATETLCDLALRRGDLAEAERLARSVVDERPAYAYHVLALIRDHRGLVRDDWRQRLEAAATMRSLAAIAESDGVRADALLFSASVALEVAPFLNQSDDVLMDRVRSDLDEAIAAAGRARQASHVYAYELVMGQIRALSEDEQEAAHGAQMLRQYTSGALRTERAVTALAKYHLKREEWNDASTLITSLTDRYLWNRIFWILRRSGQYDYALNILDKGPLKETGEYPMLRADLLLQSEEEAQQAEGRRILADIVEDREAETGRALRALLILAMRADLQTAREVAETAKVQERNDPRINAFLASLLSADESDKERGLELAQQLAQETMSPAESQDIMRLLTGGGVAAFEQFLDTQVEKGGATGFQYRLQRAVTLLARARQGGSEDEEVQQLRQRVRKDLIVLRGDANVTKPALIAGFNLAAALGDVELAGSLLGRAVTMRGEPEILDARLLRLVVELRDAEVAAALGAGVRSTIADSSAKAYLEAFAKALENALRDRDQVMDDLEGAAKEEASRRLALELACRIALGTGKLDRAEALARAALAADDKSIAREVLGRVMLSKGASEEVVTMYRSLEEMPEYGYYQVAGALMHLERKEEALASAREALDRFPGSVMAHVLVARVYIDIGERRKALTVLNVAPQNAFVLHLRADLLRHFSDLTMAQQLYEVLLTNSNFSDLQAWQGFFDVLTRRERSMEFVEIAAKVLARPEYLKDNPGTRGALHYLQGVALEQEGKLDLCIAAYEEAIRISDTNWLALNNAAWHIATTNPARIDEARAYIEKALKLRPNDPAVMDTAAEVYARSGDAKAALGHIDSALMLKPEGKVAKYMVHKGEILLRLDREEEARSILEEVRKDHPDTPAASRARDIIWELDRKNLPEREIEEPSVDDLPPEREDDDGEG